MDIANLRKLRHVPRCVILPAVQPQNVAEHSFHVAYLFLYLCERVYAYKPSMEEMERVLAHDENESQTGDMPSPCKGLRDPTSAFDAVLTVADKIEFLLWCEEEAMVGNRRLNVARAFTWDKGRAAHAWLWEHWGGVTRFKKFGDVYEYVREGTFPHGFN